MVYLFAYWIIAFAIYGIIGCLLFRVVGMIFSLKGITSGIAWKIAFTTMIPVIGFIWPVYLIHSSLGKINQFSVWKSIGICAIFFVTFGISLAFPSFLLNSFGLNAFRVSGSSMAETYRNGEYVVANKFVYAVSDPERGDVAIVMPGVDNGRTFYLQRVIGLPGDEVMFDNGIVLIKKSGEKDFSPLDEPYLSAGNKNGTLPGKSSTDSVFLVPDGEYFLMGDNRKGSADSRDCFMTCESSGATHYVKRSGIVGRVTK